jgi:hypothetical protein
VNDQPIEQSDFYLIFGFIIVPICLILYRVFFRTMRIGTELINNPYVQKAVYAAIALGLLVGVFGAFRRWNKHVENLVLAVKRNEKQIYLGKSQNNDELFLSTAMRTRHTQVIGTTSSGKSESVILPWAIQDIQNRGGIIIVDGKADRSFLDKIYAYTVAAGRANDFRLFSLSNPHLSCTFNPLAVGSVQEVTERVFSSFQFENEYYESVQFRIFREMIAVIKEQNVVPTFAHLLVLLTNKDALATWIEASRNDALKETLTGFNNLAAREKDEKVSGLVAKISHFCADEISPLFNSREPHLDLGQALKHGLICYFQLPTMYYQFLGASAGKLVLQCLQNAVAKRHNEGGGAAQFTAVYLDDFQDYIYEGFEALLNKSRSANVGMVFSHQALGDLDKVSPAFRNIVTTNTNIKIVMRNNDPETAEFFASSFGTTSSSKETERVSRGIFGSKKTGELSVRAVEEFLFHPNLIKSELATGEAIVSIPHFERVETQRVKFTPFPDIKPKPLPAIPKGTLEHATFLKPPGRFDQTDVHRL